VTEEVAQTELFDPLTIPVHVFGITGDMIPILSYLGVDTFDSSTHVQAARALGYYDPETWRPMRFDSLERLECECAACLHMAQYGLRALQRIIHRPGRQTHRGGHTRRAIIKSEIYAAIAWHNLLLQLQEVEHTRRALFDGDLIEHVVRFGSARPRTEKLLSYLAKVDLKVEQRLSHLPPTIFENGLTEVREREYSLAYSSADFDVASRAYSPRKQKDVLLLLPCSAEKPYSKSRSHQLVMKALKQALGDRMNCIEKVSVSGLYGPVPHKFESEEPVHKYNYYLTSSAHKQMELITERLTRFLQDNGECFPIIVGYATSKAYRRVIRDALSRFGRGVLLPTILGPSSVAQFPRAENLEQLSQFVKTELDRVPLTPNSGGLHPQ
jgi:predicted RNA-binding protein